MPTTTPEPEPEYEDEGFEDEPEVVTAPAAETQSAEVSENRQKFLAGEMRWRDYVAAENEAHAEPLDS